MLLSLAEKMTPFYHSLYPTPSLTTHQTAGYYEQLT